MELESEEIRDERDTRYAMTVDKRGWIWVEYYYITPRDRQYAGLVRGKSPAALAIDREGRQVMEYCLQKMTDRNGSCMHTGKQVLIRPMTDELRAAMEEALINAKNVVPVMDVTDFEKAAYAEDSGQLVAKVSHGANPALTAGKSYKIGTSSYTFRKQFKRKMVHYDENTKSTFTKDHDCELSGQDKAIFFTDDKGQTQIFRDQPNLTRAFEHDETKLWRYFDEPDIKTIVDLNPDKYQENLEALSMCEMISNFEYYPGQKDYIARVGIKDSMLIGAAVGTGKSLTAISLIAMKSPSRALIVAPRGVVRDPDDDDDDDTEMPEHGHWTAEINKFAPYLEVFKINSRDDYDRIKRQNGGQLPPGVYLSYYEAMFRNKAMESVPKTWDDEKMFNKLQIPALPKHPTGHPRGWANTVGEERHGIRCVITPCLATEIGHEFDMVVYDEAHTLTNMDATVTQMAIRLQPKYRYAMTATPIPNVVTNLFSVMGWVVVPGWYKGTELNAEWPYRRGDISRFATEFQCKEQDFTKERIKLQKAKSGRVGPCIKNSPTISSPARLLKLIKPNLAYISKEICNPNLVDREVIDIRVDMGKQQAALYEHFCDMSNIPGRDPFAVHRRQAAYLRGICADPVNFKHSTPKSPEVKSNMNPKLVACLELIAEKIRKGEQVTVVYSRIGQANELAARLDDAGIQFSRIDGSTTDRHTQESNAFKRGETMVMLMGIKCAMGHSYPECPNLIIISLEYSYGTFEQALGRVWRVNSTRDVKIYVILCRNSIEELMFDIVATKGDAATICLQGNRVPNDFKPVDASEVLANAMSVFEASLSKPEDECEKEWPTIKASMVPYAEAAAA